MAFFKLNTARKAARCFLMLNGMYFFIMLTLESDTARSRDRSAVIPKVDYLKKIKTAQRQRSLFCV